MHQEAIAASQIHKARLGALGLPPEANQKGGDGNVLKNVLLRIRRHSTVLAILRGVIGSAP